MGQEPEELRQDPDALRHDIDRTREGMDATLDQIEDRISPRRMVERRKARVREAWGSARERVMGTAEQVRHQGQARADQAGGRLEDVRGEMSQRKEHLQEEAKRQYQGNPLAAGLIAFGAGALLGSLLPRTEPERQLAQDVQERLQPVAEELKASGQEVAEEVKHEAQDRVEDVKDTASEAANTVKDEARGSAEQLREETRDRAEAAKDEAER